MRRVSINHHGNRGGHASTQHIPSVREAIHIIGASGFEVISVIHLRDVNHTLKLSKKSQKYCCNIPYYGSDKYLS